MDQAKALGASDPELSYTAEGLVNEDQFIGVLQRVAGEEVGIYQIQQGSLSLGSNYALNFIPGYLTVGLYSALREQRQNLAQVHWEAGQLWVRGMRGEVILSNALGRRVATLRVERDGAYALPLVPGSYWLRSKSFGSIPLMVR